MVFIFLVMVPWLGPILQKQSGDFHALFLSYVFLRHFCVFPASMSFSPIVILISITRHSYTCSYSVVLIIHVSNFFIQRFMQRRNLIFFTNIWFSVTPLDMPAEEQIAADDVTRYEKEMVPRACWFFFSTVSSFIFTVLGAMVKWSGTEFVETNW